MARQDHEIGTNVDVSGTELTGFVGEDESVEDIDVLGFATLSTVGEVTVPRDWLVPRMQELGLPDFMIPNEPSPKSAFKRALKEHRVIDSDEYMVNGHRVKYAINKGDNNTFHVLANVFVEGEQNEDSDDGEWRQATLGVVRYDDDTENIVTISRVEDEHPLYSEWERLAGLIQDLFEELQESHVGYDFQVITYHLRKHWTQSVPLRDGGAVAFIPYSEQTADVLEALGVLFHEIDELYKDTGRHIHMSTIPVLDMESQRRMIRNSVEEELRDEVTDLADEVGDLVADEVPVDEIVAEVEDELGEAENFAANYNTLLELELTIDELLEEWQDEFSDEVAEVGRRLLQRDDDVTVESAGGGWYEVSDGEQSLKVQGAEKAQSLKETWTAEGFDAAESATAN